MRSFLRCTLLALPLLGGAIAEQPKTQTSDAANSIYANAQEAFQDLLNALPEESLQAALNSLTKFKEGVFESHRRGVEHVHNSSPALATKLIVAAVQDLKKRQVAAPSNGTTPAQTSQTPDAPQSSAQESAQQQSSQAPENTQQQTSEQQTSAQQTNAQQTTEQQTSAAPAPVTSANAPSTPTSRPVLLPVEVTTTNQQGRTIVQTSEVFSEVTASVQVTVTRTTTDQQGRTTAVTTQEVRPAVIRTTTDERGSQVAVTSAAMYAPTRGEVITTTNAQGSTFLTTYTPGGGRVSSVKLVTTTDAEGRPQTITSVTYVDPTAEGGDDSGSGASPTATGKPSVQSGSAHKADALKWAAAGAGALAIFF
ncbi:hypothetical protein N0V94_008595 [Neodidymelliopsis sp. IMI 364377]|nr:hypothetical protein N0V94_008595 [Neodidymelliopsis sp. IMI 364377]